MSRRQSKPFFSKADGYVHLKPLATKEERAGAHQRELQVPKIGGYPSEVFSYHPFRKLWYVYVTRNNAKPSFEKHQALCGASLQGALTHLGPTAVHCPKCVASKGELRQMDTWSDRVWRHPSELETMVQEAAATSWLVLKDFLVALAELHDRTVYVPENLLEVGPIEIFHRCSPRRYHKCEADTYLWEGSRLLQAMLGPDLLMLYRQEMRQLALAEMFEVRDEIWPEPIRPAWNRHPDPWPEDKRSWTLEVPSELPEYSFPTIFTALGLPMIDLVELLQLEEEREGFPVEGVSVPACTASFFDVVARCPHGFDVVSSLRLQGFGRVCVILDPKLIDFGQELRHRHPTSGHPVDDPRLELRDPLIEVR